MTEQNRTPRTGGPSEATTGPGRSHGLRGSRRRGLRRAAVTLALSAVVAGGLTACNTQPGAAAFVGDQRYTQNQVNTIFDSVRDDVHGDLSQDANAKIRKVVAANLVIRDLAKRVATSRHLAVPSPDYTGLAQTLHLPESDKYVRLGAQADAYVSAIHNAATPVAPNDADVKELYHSLIGNGVNPGQFSLQDFRKQVNNPDVGKVVATRNTLVAATHKYHVDISPRYGKLLYPLAIPLPTAGGRFAVGSLSVPLGKGTPHVVTPPTPAADKG